ncbi:MAG: hypothetical protein KDD50_08540 [Bdellovibrionales bacterium]|nr:hypothetical protein [Bdellovibrionales bacterium]
MILERLAKYDGEDKTKNVEKERRSFQGGSVKITFLINCAVMFLLYSTIGVKALAQGVSQKNHDFLIQSQSREVIPEKPDKTRDWGIELNSYGLIRSQTRYFQTSQKPEFQGELSLYWKKESLHGWNFDTKGRFSVAEQSIYPQLREAYFRTEHFAYGRKKLNWFRSINPHPDGVWLPRDLWNKLNIEEEGLVGAFFDRSWKSWSAKAFVSPFFIPEMSPQFKLVDSQFVSENIWFRAPPSELELSNVPTPVNYALAETSPVEIALKPGVGFMLAYDRQSWGVRVGAAYKPMNQILLGAPVSLGLTEEGVNNLNIEVHPRTLYHELGTLEVYFNPSRWQLDWQSTFEHPFRDDPPEEWLTQEISPAAIHQALIRYSWSHRFSQFIHLYYRDGGEAQDRGEFASEKSFFEDRFFFSKATSLGFNWLISKGYSSNHQLESKMTYDSDQKGVVFGFSMFHQLSTQWFLRWGGDWIGYLNDDIPDSKQGFIGTYRANDQFYGGAKYVF